MPKDQGQEWSDKPGPITDGSRVWVTELRSLPIAIRDTDNQGSSWYSTVLVHNGANPESDPDRVTVTAAGWAQMNSFIENIDRSSTEMYYSPGEARDAIMEKIDEIKVHANM